MNINIAMLCGRITRKPEMRTTPSGTSIASFSVATNTVYKDKSGAKKEETDFHNAKAFGKTAEIICEYFDKGDEIFVQGRIQNSNYEKDGHKVYRTDIIVDKFQFGQKSKKNRDGGHDDRAEERNGGSEQEEREITVDDIPF